MKRVFITGITGFVGSHLAEHLLKNEVHGFVRIRSNMDNIKHIKDELTLHVGDITDINSISSALDISKPNEIYHLSGNSYVPSSWIQPVEVFNTNAIGIINLLEAVRKLESNPKIMIAGSSEEYGLVHKNEVPITEDQPLRPQSPYGVSKVAMDLFAQQYVASYGMKIFISRAFNHTGTRRGENFVCSNFAKQIAEIEGGKRKQLEHGNLDAVRDFLDVRDIVKAYELGLNSKDIVWGQPYNISSGNGVAIRDILKKLLSKTKTTIKTTYTTDRRRPSDVPLLIGDSSKFRKATKWKNKIELDTTLQDILDFWRTKT